MRMTESQGVRASENHAVDHATENADSETTAPMSRVSFDVGDSKVKVSVLTADGPAPDNGRSTAKHSRDASTDLRNGLRRTHANPLHVELPNLSDADNMSKMTPKPVETKDIIKIFTSDDDEFIEVSPEQLERVKKMHARMEEGATASFNYNTLLFVASILAGIGLVADSSTIVIASMLISPIMGPVVGLAYGSTIRDWRLVRKSLVTELASIVFAIFIGLAIGACTGPTNLSYGWPTKEMASRGTWQNFYVALPVAFFSGLGVAVSLLDDQASSLVGVAISASLLPPAVNAGVLWVAYIFIHSETVTDHFCHADGEEHHFASCEDIIGENYDQGVYSLGIRKLFAEMGYISLLVTLANILLIWLSSMLMFRMKEVLPIRKKVFWEDLGVARKVYQRRAMLNHGYVETSSDSAKGDS